MATSTDWSPDRNAVPVMPMPPRPDRRGPVTRTSQSRAGPAIRRRERRRAAAGFAIASVSFLSKVFSKLRHWLAVSFFVPCCNRFLRLSDLVAEQSFREPLFGRRATSRRTGLPRLKTAVRSGDRRLNYSPPLIPGIVKYRLY